MERDYSLNGAWNLYYYDASEDESLEPADLARLSIPHIPALVPGNVELDLSRAGLLPKDLFKGMAPVEAEKYEPYDWWYQKEFDAPEISEGERCVLVFEGVDCLAEYYLNGQKLGTSENAFIPHELDVTYSLRHGEPNELFVCLRAALLDQFKRSFNQYLLSGNHMISGIYLRKPAHCFGWDIFPRAVTAGLWKDVRLTVRGDCAIEDVSYLVRFYGGMTPYIIFDFNVSAPVKKLLGGELSMRVRGQCGDDSSFEGVYRLDRQKAGQLGCGVKNPKLWWPYGYGEANIYDTVIELLDGGEVVDEKRLNVGLRKLELKRTETLEDDNPCFKFIINGTDIMCRGSNWVPLEVYHSRDRERYDKALALASDIGCNMLRIWGGGVYEQDCFYDYCDRHGIMVWQDFMMACQACPQDENMLSLMEKEFTWAICELRTHPSIVLWAGDNEIDEKLASWGINPSVNVITRKLLPALVAQHDPMRPYLPSSPYIGEKIFAAKGHGRDIMPERHLWGARDYYKADFYKQSRAYFVSETGYHGCPSPESVKKIVDEDSVWPYLNEQWKLHSSDQHGNDGRVRLMADQIRQLFALEPQTLEDFSLASQISQAEAKKYFIERVRLGRPDKSGILWWNLLDGWPQMSDAVVDYFYDKKLAYSYIKRAQAPFALMMDELHDWHYTLAAANDTLEAVSGNYRVTDIDTGTLYAEGKFTAATNNVTRICEIRMMYSEQRMLLIEWNVNGKTACNHYLCGMPAFSFEQYTGWLKKLRAVCGE